MLTTKYMYERRSIVRDAKGREEARIRRLSIAEARRDGLTMEEVGKRYGISVVRVYQILKRVKRDAEKNS